MSYQTKYDQLNQQSSILAKKLEEIKKKQSSSANVTSDSKKIDNSGEEKKVALINNDGNFMENFLKMNSSKKDSGEIGGMAKKTKIQPSSGPLAKKSRFSSMFQQMKKAKQPITPAVETPVTYASATCFHGEDSSSSDEESVSKTLPSSSKFHAAPRDVKAAIINPVKVTPMVSSVTPIVSSIKPVVSSIKPIVTSVKPSSESTPEAKPLTKERTKPRKNRWGEKVDLSEIAPPGLANMPGVANIPTPVVPQPVGLAAMSETQRKQLQEQKEMQAMYSLIMANRAASQQSMMMQKQAAIKQKAKYEYDRNMEHGSISTED